MGMAPPGEDVPTELVITEHGKNEEWVRSFGGRRLRSVQSAGADNLLLERVGPSEISVRFEVRAGALYYRQTGSALSQRPGRLSHREASDRPVRRSGAPLAPDQRRHP